MHPRKRRIEALAMIRDIRSGMTDPDLMDKYRLSRIELEHTKRRLVERRERMAEDIVNDIRSGMTDLDLMSKYQISSKGLQLAFSKLVKGKFIGRSEIEKRLPAFGEAITVEDMRRSSRKSPADEIRVAEQNRPDTCGTLSNVSEHGLCVIGIQSEVGEVKTLVIPSDDFGEFSTICFDAKCRWVKQKENGDVTAGFEITNITRAHCQELGFLIRSKTLDALEEL
jgi:uncharacterized protein (DUF433 family)